MGVYRKKILARIVVNLYEIIIVFKFLSCILVYCGLNSNFGVQTVNKAARQG